jgi:hypothetical protein
VEEKMLAALQEVIDSQRVLFAPSNADKEFIAQLCLVRLKDMPETGFMRPRDIMC